MVSQDSHEMNHMQAMTTQFENRNQKLRIEGEKRERSKRKDNYVAYNSRYFMNSKTET